MSNVKPSDIMLLGPAPLYDTLKKTEAEIAATLIIRTCQVNGDAWQAVTMTAIADVVRADTAAKAQPICSFAANPFMRPDFHELQRRGFATIVQDAGLDMVGLTDDAIARIASRWRRCVMPAYDLDTLIRQRDQARAERDTLRKAATWTAITDDKATWPRENTRVLANDGDVVFAWWSGDWWYAPDTMCGGSETIDRPLAWMPLPAWAKP